MQAAATCDRFEDYIMCTGACAVNPRSPTDGVWLLDYRAGKLLGTTDSTLPGPKGNVEAFLHARRL